jgi:hypothetical protein
MEQKERSALIFQKKAEIFSHDLLKCCFYLEEGERKKHDFTKMIYSRLISLTQVLEDFLDFHGAKGSEKWFYYRELTAAIRHISLGIYSQVHIANRLRSYELQDVGNFEQQGAESLNFLNGCMVKLAPAIIEEAQRLKIPIPQERFSPMDFPSISTNHVLDYDISDESTELQKKSVVKIASDFLSISQNFDDLGFYQPFSMDEISALVPESVNEVEMRRFEMLVHNLQSAFDTYVIHGGVRFGNQKLKQLRSHFSVVFHLLQMIGRLLHFYERHLHDAGYKNIYKNVRDRLAELVDPNLLLGYTINYGLYYVCHFLSTGKQVAKEILNDNIERGVIRVKIPEKLGFHSRPSLLVAKIVQYYGGQVELCVKENRFDASSVLDIQWAGGMIHKENIHCVEFHGDLRALKDIEILASVNYGEDTMGKGVPLPSELRYLR